jgi:glycosyltransferase involved in cell wall biosynthesis
MKRIVAAGHEMTISAYYGHRGAILQADGGVKILPGGLDEWGNDILGAHHTKYKPDVTVALMDVWVLEPEMVKKIPLTSWCPVDHDPVPPRVVEGLIPFTWIWAMSRFGEEQLKDYKYSQTVYVPHGIDTDEYFASDREAARDKWSLPQDAFVVVMNAANKGVPSRKSFEAVIKAWSVFSKYHPDSILVLHTLPLSATYGLPLVDLLNFYQVDSSTVRFPDTYNYVVGSYGPDALRDLYSGADVLLSPSMGEGFGIPVIEAQACGCPVIVTDFSAQTELAPYGYRIPVDPLDDYIWTSQQSEQARVTPSKIIAGLEWALENVGNDRLREQAVEVAAEYDADYVFDKYMHPSLKYMAEKNMDFSTGD